ncbi:MAG: hypothetical protein RIQ93_240 [Verrucomicrobiota bacterium]|jgi:hypothetical protein
MNPVTTFPRPAPELKLPRASLTKATFFVAEQRHRLEEDQEAFREHEVNLREYETRLRLWQQELEAVRATSGAVTPGQPLGSIVPAPRSAAGEKAFDEGALQAAWRKVHRARELLDVERAHLCDDRLVLRAQEAALKQREEALIEREARVVAREEEAAAADAQAKEQAIAAAARAESRPTRSPFDLARSLFGRKT